MVREMSGKNKDEMIVRRTIVYENTDELAVYLEEMAEKGWMLEKIVAGSKFVFRKTEPMKLRFAAEIFVNGSMFDTHVIESNQEYIDYCEAAGWAFVCSSADLDIFVTDREDAPEIEGDPVLKLRAIRKANRYKKVIGPLIMLAMGIYTIVYYLTVNLNETECSLLSFSTLLLWIVAMMIYTVTLGSYLVWVVKANAAAVRGERLPGRKTISYQAAKAGFILFGILHSAFAIYVGMHYQEKEMYMIPAIWAVNIIITLAASGVTAYAEKAKIGREEHRALILAVVPLCSVSVLTVVILLCIAKFGKEEVEGYGLSSAELQAFAGNLTEENVEADRTHWGHFLISFDQYSLGQHGTEDESLFAFDVYETKIASIHDRLLEEMKAGKYYRMLSVRFHFDRATEDTSFADGISVYRYEENGGENGDTEYIYLLYDKEVIVYARCGSELSGEQMAMIREAFM